MRSRGPTRLKARRRLVTEGRGLIDYEQKYKEDDRERKVLASTVSQEIYQKTSAPDSRTYWRNPTYWGGSSWYWGDQFNVRMPIIEALPPWAWVAMLGSIAFFTVLVVVMILLMA